MKLKSLLGSYFKHFSYFLNHLGYRVFIALGLSIAVGLLDGLGLAMFLPMLEMVGGETEATHEGLGKLSFILDAMEAIGLSLNLTSVLLVMLFFFSLKGLAKFLESYYKIWVNNYFVNRLRVQVIDLLSHFNYKNFVTTDAGRIQNTLSGEVNLVSGAYMAYFSMLQAGVMLIVYIGLAYLSNPQFALLVTAGGFLSNLAFKVIYKKTIKLSRAVTNERHDYQGLLIQMVAFFKYLKATGLALIYGDKLKESVKEIERTNLRIGLYNSLLLSVREPIVVLIVVTVIYVQVTFFGQALGLIVLALLFFYRALNFVLNVQTQWNKFLNVSGSLENMQAFQKELSEGAEQYGENHVNKIGREIRIENLSFSYGNVKVLQDVTLTLPCNRTIAFVGESGSGKTTLINLMSGLMPIDEGDILIEGLSIRNINQPTYQKRIGYITQEPVIFNDTIYNNVSFWAPKTRENLDRFWEALKKASIVDYVKGIEDKENALLGNNGLNLSGGQKQRISIARELFKDIEILIMDEATSALDSETELAIQQNIDNLRGVYTIFIVAHRLSTIKNSDIVVMMDKGRVIESGGYNEMLSKSKKFQRMVALQDLVNN